MYSVRSLIAPITKAPEAAAKVPEGTVNWKTVVMDGTTKSVTSGPSLG